MKVCAQHSAAIKKAREMVGHSRDGNEGNMEYIIKSSHKPVGCPHLELCPLLWSSHAPWSTGQQRGRRAGGTAVESTSRRTVCHCEQGGGDVVMEIPA